jgi:succinate-semialdehyde dehydrogenase / glutarate-semialdehyde dehydrogenase
VTGLHIDGRWCGGSDGGTLPILDPATGEEVGRVAVATRPDLERAVSAAEAGFRAWRRIPAHERCRRMRVAAGLLRERADAIARLLTGEQGKPLAEAQAEVALGAEAVEWFAEEGRRAYGRVIPARTPGAQALVLKEPVGPVAAFTPWNFPVVQAVRKVSAALAAGCSMVLKGPEETPRSCAEMVRAFADAGLPAGVLNLVYGDPAEISEFLITHPAIRKISFTGSTAVGKHLAMLAGRHMKRTTMELGGHAPALVFDDADIEGAAALLVAGKYRNAGQVCVSPTRILVQEATYDRFLETFLAGTGRIRVGNGLDPSTVMGPLANTRRVEAMERLVADAVASGGTLLAGGQRIGNKGFFFQPTVLANVPASAAIMNEEPFGPVAIVNRFSCVGEAVAEANRLPFGLAAYAYTRSSRTALDLASSVEAGMLTINHHGLGLPEAPFGGVKESGYGSEGGTEALEAYLAVKFVSQVGV